MIASSSSWECCNIEVASPARPPQSFPLDLLAESREIRCRSTLNTTYTFLSTPNDHDYPRPASFTQQERFILVVFLFIRHRKKKKQFTSKIATTCLSSRHDPNQRFKPAVVAGSTLSLTAHKKERSGQSAATCTESLPLRRLTIQQQRLCIQDDLVTARTKQRSDISRCLKLPQCQETLVGSDGLSDQFG